MTKRQTMISILALVVIAACIAVAMMYPPSVGEWVYEPGVAGSTTTYLDELMQQRMQQEMGIAELVGARSAALRNVMYLVAAATAALAVILSISPWGRSKD